MYETESSSCKERVWVVTLWACNCLSAALGVIIFGLSLCTIRSEIFVLEVWQFLEPVFQIACADIACGVFMCVVAGFGLCYLYCRNLLVGKAYFVVIVLMFTYQLSIGISTVVISDEKTDYVRAVAILLCVDPTLKFIHNVGESAIEVGADRFGIDYPDKRLSKFVRNHSPLDILYAQHDPSPSSIEECSYFVDVLTPCGALLICGSIVYLYMLYCTSCIRDLDKRYGKSDVRRPWQGAIVASAAGKRPFEVERKVQFQDQFLGASPTMYSPQPGSAERTPHEAV